MIVAGSIDYRAWYRLPYGGVGRSLFLDKCVVVVAPMNVVRGFPRVISNRRSSDRDFFFGGEGGTYFQRKKRRRFVVCFVALSAIVLACYACPLWVWVEVTFCRARDSPFLKTTQPSHVEITTPHADDVSGLFGKLGLAAFSICMHKRCRQAYRVCLARCTSRAALFREKRDVGCCFGAGFFLATLLIHVAQ